MKVMDLRINGVENPVGFAYDTLKCSWKVRESSAKRQKRAKIEVSLSDTFDTLLLVQEGETLNSAGEQLQLTCQPMTRYYYRVEMETDEGEIAVSRNAFFETGKMDQAWTADWIGTQAEDHYHPIFRRRFSLRGPVHSARLYITGLGLYEVMINSHKAGDEYLAPLYSDYHTEIQYQTYDVTGLLTENNSIDIMLGNGWYKGRFGLGGLQENFGSEFACIAELHITGQSGEVEVIKTDESWSYLGSDLELSDIYDGEILNRCLWNDQGNPEKPVRVMNLDTSKLVSRYSLPVKVKEERYPERIIHTPAGETVLDMGQNLSGFIEFTNTFPRGTELVFDFGEILQNSNFYNDNYRSAKSQYVYISGGSAEKVRPRFTFFGFRYVRVTGWTGVLAVTDIVAKIIYSDLDTSGFIETSNEKINRLYQNALWGQKSNFIDFPTDCPQRDERLAWTGDAQVFAGTASYNMDTRAFYRKFIHDLRTEQQKHKGIIPAFIPVFGPPIACSVWGDIGTFLPMVLYRHYGDRELLEQHFPMMKDWADYITGEDKQRGQRYLYNFGAQIGDWLAQDGRSPQSFKGGTDDYFISSCYYYESVRLVAEAAEILGKSYLAGEYGSLAEKIKSAILAEYFTSTGRLSIDTQTGYLVALNFGIYHDKPKLIEGLRERLYKDCYKLTSGFVGAPVLCRVLAENGMEEEALNFLLQEEYPSWLYCVNLGATTVWERWNSVLPDGTISGTLMNSLNHYAYGSIVEYLYRNLGGLVPLAPGFKKVRFAPQINRKFKTFKVVYDSVCGTYGSEWKVQSDGSVAVRFEVPFACSAEVHLPEYTGGVILLGPGVHELTYQPLKDFRNLFSMNSPLAELVRNERALEILQRILPGIFQFLPLDDIDGTTHSLNTLAKMEFFGITRGDIELAAQEILKLQE
ncbi:family 78 glycoside hydrolase catalytic domain [Paenibacillus sp. MMS20-IR301]|uniref:alpha-L-rhamnosidase n=1 Tax=Paenibacillus sp. MMS20-IR301 TaxID=2895946 RepID=UPI0028EEDFF1|nr:family 78 glycoside hydrolase catalytic domain [Paenibacillus sp. MMS20-IR301]WNS46039.1 family 78 glycoside hydrolase catalytic domain [Paenibacillus sp. MMS20-IR301]